MLLSDSVLSCDSLLLSEVVSPLSDSLFSESEDEVSEELDDSLPELVLALRALNEDNR